MALVWVDDPVAGGQLAECPNGTETVYRMWPVGDRYVVVQQADAMCNENGPAYYGTQAACVAWAEGAATACA